MANELNQADAPIEDVEPENVEAAPDPEQAPPDVEPTEPEPDKPTDEIPDVDGKLQGKVDELEKKFRDQAYYIRKLEQKTREPARSPEAEIEPELPAEAPKEDDFETYEQYQDALVDFKVDSKIASYEVKQAEKGHQQGMQTFVQDLVTDGIAKFGDFEEVAMSITTPVTQQMVEIFQNCENPVDVAYHMGKNPQVAASISRMTRDAAVREITKIDLEIGASGPAPAAPAPKTVTNAPPPIKPSRSENVIGKDPEKMTQTEYEKWREDGGGN